LLTAIYIITPYDVSRQLIVSIDRVTIAPLGLLALMMATGEPPRSATSHPEPPASGSYDAPGDGRPVDDFA
jgi:hypothetical protein